MGKIHGIDVILFESIQVGVDEFNRPIIEYAEGKEIHNVLVAPASAEEITNELNLSGKRITYNLAIPKEDMNTWENGMVVFFGRTWRVVGIPEMGIEDLIPLAWNKKVKVEAYE